MSLHIAVTDCTLPHWDSPHHAYLPFIHFFNKDLPPHPDPAIELIDLTETWKGLSSTEACLLRWWYNAIRDALKKHIERVVLGNLEYAGLTVGKNSDADTIHQYVLALGHQIVAVDIDSIIEDVLEQKSRHTVNYRRDLSAFLPGSDAIGIVNLLRLCPCFWDDAPNVYVFFTSEVTKHGDVNVYAEVRTRPHIFYVDAENGGLAFRSPTLDKRRSPYDVVMGAVQRDPKGADALVLHVSTVFRGKVSFNRVYRFRHNLTHESQGPDPGPIARPKTGTVKKGKRSGRKVREISQNSIRVQGMSDFERAARESHPHLYRVHHDHGIGKNYNLGTVSKLFGAATRLSSPERPTTNVRSFENRREEQSGSPQRMGSLRGGCGTIRHVEDVSYENRNHFRSTSPQRIGMMEDYQSIRRHLGTLSFRPPPPPDTRGIVDDSEPLLSSDPLPSPSSPSYLSSDEEDLYAFSPVKVRPGILSSPTMISRPPRPRPDVRKMFASSPSHNATSPAKHMRIASPEDSDSPTRNLDRILGAYPRPIISPGHFSHHASSPSVSTAVWRGSGSSLSAKNSEDEVWKPRKRNGRYGGIGGGKGKGKEVTHHEREKSHESIGILSPGSVGTVEISPPASEESAAPSLPSVY